MVQCTAATDNNAGYIRELRASFLKLPYSKTVNQESILGLIYKDGHKTVNTKLVNNVSNFIPSDMLNLSSSLGQINTRVLKLTNEKIKYILQNVNHLQCYQTENIDNIFISRYHSNQKWPFMTREKQLKEGQFLLPGRTKKRMRYVVCYKIHKIFLNEELYRQNIVAMRIIPYKQFPNSSIFIYMPNEPSTLINLVKVVRTWDTTFNKMNQKMVEISEIPEKLYIPDACFHIEHKNITKELKSIDQNINYLLSPMIKYSQLFSNDNFTFNPESCAISISSALYNTKSGNCQRSAPPAANDKRRRKKNRKNNDTEKATTHHKFVLRHPFIFVTLENESVVDVGICT